jgi:hypothetical protein
VHRAEQDRHRQIQPGVGSISGDDCCYIRHRKSK